MSVEPPCIWHVATLAGGGPGSQGYLDGVGTAARFNWAGGVASDAAGNVYVADAINYRIRVISPGAAVSTLAGSGMSAFADGTGTAASFFFPRHVAVHPLSGDVYCSDKSRIRIITTSGVTTTFAGSDSRAWAAGSGTGASFSPNGIAIDAAGVVYVADSDNIRIIKISPAGDVTALAGTGIGTNSAFFSYPTGIAVDGTGNVYVADLFYILKVTPAAVVTTVAGSGIGGAIDGVGTAASFHTLKGLTLASDGNLYVSDANYLRRISPGAVVTTVAGSSGSGFANGFGTSASFSWLYGVAAAASGNLFGSDDSSIRRLTCVPCPAGTFGSAPGLTSPACSGACSAAPGFGCAAGSTSAANVTQCQPGTYCPGGSPAPVLPCVSIGNCPSAGLSAETPCVWQVTTLAGRNGVRNNEGYYGGYADGVGTLTQFYLPVGVAVDAAGFIYAAEGFGNQQQ
jgi:hypothetical protein